MATTWSGGKLEAAPLQTVRFRYENWRGVEHVYEVDVESFQFGPWQKSGLIPNAPKETHTWVMHGHVVTRDGMVRANPGGTRRTFILKDIQDLEVLT